MEQHVTYLIPLVICVIVQVIIPEKIAQPVIDLNILFFRLFFKIENFKLINVQSNHVSIMEFVSKTKLVINVCVHLIILALTVKHVKYNS